MLQDPCGGSGSVCEKTAIFADACPLIEANIEIGGQGGRARHLSKFTRWLFFSQTPAPSTCCSLDAMDVMLTSIDRARQSGPVRPNPTQPGPARPSPTQPDPTRPSPTNFRVPRAPEARGTLKWAGLGRVGSGWVGLGRAGPGWVGLCRTGPDRRARSTSKDNNQARLGPLDEVPTS